MGFWSSNGAPFATVTAALKHGRFCDGFIIRMYLCVIFSGVLHSSFAFSFVLSFPAAFRQSLVRLNKKGT